MSVLRSNRRVGVVFVWCLIWFAGVAAAADPGAIGEDQNRAGLHPDDTSWMSTDLATLAKAADTATWSTCTPARVAVFSNRVHVRCTVANAGIFYYAFSTKDPSAVARVLALLNGALLTGRTLLILNDPADTSSGPPVGCQAGDCRLILALEVL
jgi:hypothetical protein